MNQASRIGTSGQDDPSGDSSLEQHERRVAEAQKKLVSDVESLAFAGETLQRNAVRTTLGWALLGGAVLCGGMLVRAVHRSITASVRSTSRTGRSLARAALKSLALEIFRRLCARALVRVLPVHVQSHQLTAGQRAPRADSTVEMRNSRPE